MAAGQSSDVNISDVFEVIETVEMSAGTSDNGANQYAIKPKPKVRVVVQPASKALRFRYECEGRSAGSIPGVNSTHENKTYPTIEVPDYEGSYMVIVSLVTKDRPHRPHPHNLVGKEGCQDGVYKVKTNTNTVSFPNLGIQCVKKKDIEASLSLREKRNIDPFQTGFSHKHQPSNIDLNCVRLCFQVFLEGPRKNSFAYMCEPVVSDPIYDKKAMSDLTICKLSHCSDSVAGGQEVILLCEKIAKEDITVRFYEERNNELYWEAQGDFQPVQVHKQVAIPFKVPQYKTIHIDRPVSVMLQLRRPSDGAVSESVPFTYTPLDSDPAILQRKRKKYGGESSPQNMLIPPHSDDSRSSYGMSPDMGNLLQVKSEPTEYSPASYYGGSASPGYAVRSPEPISPHKTPSPVPRTNYSNFNLLKLNSGGGILEVNEPYKREVLFPVAGTSKQTAGAPLMPYPSNYAGRDLGEGGSGVWETPVQQGMNPDIIGSMGAGTAYHHGLLQKNESVTNRSQIPVETGNTFINMDSLHTSTEINTNHLDTDELNRMVMTMTETNLSAHLSNNLTLDDSPMKSSEGCDQSTMTDSYAMVSDNGIQELMQFNNMNRTSHQ